MTWLITGGAGYIGAHVVRETLASGRKVVILDDMSTGIARRIPEGVALEQVTLTDATGVKSVFERHDISGVLHLAARKQVGESVEKPLYYWEENVTGFNNLMSAMTEHDVKNLVFSSSAAVYGQPDLEPGALITEETHCSPINPYGATKLAGEWISAALAQANSFRVAALRYFNVAGAGTAELGDEFILNLVPIVFDALTKGNQPRVFGDDYATPDGSCVRDYVHVQDLAEAHVAAMDYVEKPDTTFAAINIGTGAGASVFEVLDVMREVTGLEINPIHAGRRAGDPPALIADVSKAAQLLNWRSKFDLHDIVTSAWEAWQERS
jgi:UDP-glucose 4-epimerase